MQNLNKSNYRLNLKDYFIQTLQDTQEKIMRFFIEFIQVDVDTLMAKI